MAPIWQQAPRSIAVVTSVSPRPDRQIAEDLSLVAAGDTQVSFVSWHKDSPPEDRDPHIFIGVEGDRAVSYLMLERRFRAWSGTWEEYATTGCRSVPASQGFWSVSFVWVTRGNRRKGWARRSLQVAMRHLGISHDTLAWHTPFTDLGQALAQSLYPEGLLIAK
jgi:hypothetical protein